MIIAAAKACRACGEVKRLEEFHNSRNADGRANTCKPCAYARSQSLRKQKQARQGASHVPKSKHCASCGIIKPSAEFAVYRAANDGLGRFCRVCDSVHSRSRRYGLPRETAAQMTANEACECCGQRFSDSRHQHIDHRHSDGAVRGVLCSKCNSLVGISLERPDVLRAAADYLVRTLDVDYREQAYPVTRTTHIEH